MNHDPFGGIQALLSPNGLQWRVVPFQDRDRGAWRDLARADRHESASHVQGKGGMVGRSRGYHSPPRGFGAVESVEQYGGDAPPERAGVHHEAADIQGAVLEPDPGHRSGQADLVVSVSLHSGTLLAGLPMSRGRPSRFLTGRQICGACGPDATVSSTRSMKNGWQSRSTTSPACRSSRLSSPWPR